MAALAFLNWPGYTDVERELDSVCRARPLSVLCQYQQAATKDARLREITGIHLGGIRQRLLVAGPAPHGGLALAGGVDMSNGSVLASALQAAVAQAGNSFHLELAGCGSSVRLAAGCWASEPGGSAMAVAGSC